MTEKDPCIILDLDNCIANDEWRVPLIRWDKTGFERYHAYHAAAYYDEPRTGWILGALINHGVDVERVVVDAFVLTARPVVYRELTEQWLRKHLPLLVRLKGLLMRNHGNYCHSVDVKKEQVAQMLEHWDVDIGDIIFAADDRSDVIEMYKGLGLRPLQQAIHSTCAYTEPSARTLSVPEVLRSAAKTYEERNAVYGDNWRKVGAVMAAMYPDGMQLRNADDFDRWHLFELIVVKLTRFANSGLTHLDSIHDAMVYAGMLESINLEKGQRK